MKSRLFQPAFRAGAAFAVLSVIAGCQKTDDSANKPKPVPEAGFVTLAAQDVPLTLELPGRTAAIEIADVRPQVSGVLKSRGFREGSIVQRGQTLYQIDPSVYEAAVAEARANLVNARALEQAAAERVRRYRPLVAAQAVSEQELTDAIAAQRQAAAQVQQRQASLQTALINLRFTRVPAPITGRIGRSFVTTGALATANQAQPLAQIQRLDPMFVDIQQSSAEMLRLRRSLATGDAARGSAEVALTLEDGTRYPLPGRLEFTEAVVEPQTGTVTLRARFPNPDGILLPGMYVRATLAQAVARGAILVPQAGVSRDPAGRATVMLAGPGDKAVLRQIEAERTVGDSWLVTKGLAVGDRVIVEGLSRVKPGGPIRPVAAGTPEAVPGQTARPNRS